MHNTVQIDGNQNLMRDLGSKAILNTNFNEINRYQEQKRILEKNKNITQEIEQIKTELSEIKNMFSKILEKLQG